jgi:ketosteroid isomerase-like protein
MAHKNEELLRKVDEAMAKGDPSKMFAMFADDAVIHIGGRSKLAGDYKGIDQIQEGFGKFVQAVGGAPEFDTHDILANDEHGVLIQTVRATRGGERVAIQGFAILNFTGGKVTEAWFNDLDPYTADPFYDAGLK